MRVTRRLLAMTLQTANEWHSDSDEGGRHMLVLSSTRKIHSEEHRQGLQKAIKQNIQSVLGENFTNLTPASRRKTILLLLDLYEVVGVMLVGAEWLTDAENLRLNEELFQEGKI